MSVLAAHTCAQAQLASFHILKDSARWALAGATASSRVLAVLVAYYLDGLTGRETATRLNLTRHQVRTRHEQAIELLRQLC